MKYFTKYLPVEGEIKKGDRVIDPDFASLGTRLEALTDKEGKTIKERGGSKVKLFLCSRDIQVGDKYFHDTYHPYPKGDMADTNTKVMNAHMMVSNEGENYDGDWSYKVIGEISPEATWVTEGTEFEDDDISVYDVSHLPDTICYIKGPCGHFH